MVTEIYLFGAAILLILCVVCSKATGRMGIPTLVVFLAIGVLAGTEGIGNIEFKNVNYAQSLGVTALAYILFSGGLDTKWNVARPVLKAGSSLATLGVLLTCVFMGLFIHMVLDYSILESFLIGAIVSSTDAGAVYTVLRSKQIHLKGRLRSLLELESGLNDPMAVFLTTMFLQLIQIPEFEVVDFIPTLIQQMSLGLIIGYISGKAIAWSFNRIKLDFEGLYMVMSLAVVLLIYSGAQLLKGNGFLAVYVAGVVLNSEKFVFKKSLAIMHDGVSWLMQSVMFLSLGLLLMPSEVMTIATPGILISGFMILLARPLSVFISLAFSRFNWREKCLISWVGLRGAVPIVMATYPLVAGVHHAGLVFNLVFFIALSSLLVQGTSISRIARWLKVYDPFAVTPANYSSVEGSLNDIVTVKVPPHSFVAKKTIVDLDIAPEFVLIVCIERFGEVIIPRGSTELEVGDELFVLADDENLAEFVELLYQDFSKIKKTKDRKENVTSDSGGHIAKRNDL